MIFKFTVLSDEVDQFVRIIEIDSEATFFDLHDAILEAVGYEKNQMTSFFLCSDDWEKKQEITLIEMDSGSEYDNLVMEKTRLDECLDDEKQKLLYVFDMLSERAFFIELSEIITGTYLDKAICTSSIGEAPVQIIADLDAPVAAPVVVAPQNASEENFYGDQEFDMEDIENQGFEDLDFAGGNPFDD